MPPHLVRGRRGWGKDILDIKVYENNVKKALIDLKRQLRKEGLFREIKNRRFYEKPSEKKKRKRREAQRQRMKALRYKQSSV